MHHARFRDPAGSIREGTYDPETDTVAFAGEEYALDDPAIDVLPPAEPTKIVCIGRNYADHAAELDNDVPDRPLLFLKPPNALASHGDEITVPAGKDRIDWGGRDRGRHRRTVQRRRRRRRDGRRRRVHLHERRVEPRRPGPRAELGAREGVRRRRAARPRDGDPDEVPADASVELRVNGETKQSSDRSYLMFDVPTLIEEITTYLTLEPGDVISTGTPEGVGALSDGDTVEVEIEGVGTLEHDVRVP